MKIKITTELMADLKDKAEKATPGPWEYGLSGFNILVASEGGKKVITSNPIEERDDAVYIAAVNPAVILALIARIEELENENRVFNQIIEDER